LWPTADAYAINLDSYEQEILQYFSQIANPLWGRTYTLPTASAVSYKNNTTNWPSVLAVMAHEIGHLKLSYTIHTKNNYASNGLDLKPFKKCSLNNTDFFAAWAYTGTAKKILPKNYWRQFSHQETADGDTPIDHVSSPYLSDLMYDPSNPQDPNPVLYTL